MHFNILLIQRETDGKFKMGARATSRHLEGAFQWYVLRAGGIRGQGGLVGTLTCLINEHTLIKCGPSEKGTKFEKIFHLKFDATE